MDREWARRDKLLSFSVELEARVIRNYRADTRADRQDQVRGLAVLILLILNRCGERRDPRSTAVGDVRIRIWNKKRCAKCL